MTQEQKIEAVKLLAATMGEAEGTKLLKDARTQFIREEVRAEQSQHDVEGIMREALAYLFETVRAMHTEELQNTEFEEWNKKVQEIKTNITKSLYN